MTTMITIQGNVRRASKSGAGVVAAVDPGGDCEGGGAGMSNPVSLVDQIMARRTAQGLRLTFRIPDRPDPFVCYPKDQASADRWLQQAREHGWERIS